MQGIFFAGDEIGSDLIDFSYPYKDFYASHLKKGEIITWNPYIGMGTPIIAEAQTGVFHPFNLLLFYFLPTPIAFNLRIILSYLILLIFTYFFTREIGLSRTASFIASVAFAFSGFMIGHLKHVPMLGAIEFFPLMLICIEKIIRSSSRLFFCLLLSILLALSIFAGHLTSTYLIVLMLVIYFFVRIAQEDSQKEKFMPYIYFFGAIVFSFLLSAAQVLNVFEIIPYSTRAVVSLEGSLAPPFLLKYLLLFLIPDIFGDPSKATWDMQTQNYWENIGYIGLIPIFLALSAIVVFLKKRFRSNHYGKKSLALFAVLLFAFVLLLGKRTPVYGWFFEFVPGFSVTRIPGRYLFFICFSLSLFAGFGFDFVKKMYKPKLWIILTMLFFILADIFYYWQSYNNALPVSFLNEPSSVRFLKKDKDIYRIRDIGRGQSWIRAWRSASGWRGDLSPYIDQGKFLSPDRNILYGIPAPSIIYEMVGHFSLNRSGILDARTTGIEYKSAMKLFGLMNVKYFIYEENGGLLWKGKPVFSEINKAGSLDLNIFENKDFLPRAFLVSGYRIMQESEILPYMKSEDFNPSQEVILEEEPKISTQNLNISNLGTVAITKYEDTKVEISAQIKSPGFLVLTDTWYPGWKATVDGKSTKIYLADYNFRALYLTSGKHKIIFSYTPTYLRAGLIVTIVSFILAFLAMLVLLFKIYVKR